MEPTAQDLEALARGYFRGAYPHLHWKDLREDEQRGLIDEWHEKRQPPPDAAELARAAEANRRMQGGSIKGKELVQRMLGATKVYVERNIKALIKELPRLLEKDLSGIVQKAIFNEMAFVNRRQEALTAANDERLTRMSQRIDAFKAYDARGHTQALDAFTRELQAEIRELQREVAELKRR
jgi:hypothetical protein